MEFEDSKYIYLIVGAFLIAYISYWIGLKSCDHNISESDKEKINKVYLDQIHDAYDSGWNDCYKTYDIENLPNALEIHQRAAKRKSKYEGNEISH